MKKKIPSEAENRSQTGLQTYLIPLGLPMRKKVAIAIIAPVHQHIHLAPLQGPPQGDQLIP